MHRAQKPFLVKSFNESARDFPSPIFYRIDIDLRLPFIGVYCIIYFAVLHGELAVPCRPQSAIAGWMLAVEAFGRCPEHPLAALIVGSWATGGREPCQIRKEAALSG